MTIITRVIIVSRLFSLRYVQLKSNKIFISRSVFQKSADGQGLLDQVCEHLNLVEKDYFGVIYRDSSDTWVSGLVWLS